MKNVLIIDGHQPYPFAPGRLNQTLAETAATMLTDAGKSVRLTQVSAGYDVEAEVDHHVWADTVIMQFPINWMGAPWSFKKYMDEVYTAGMDGRLCQGDGRSAEAPTRNYGMGGTLGGTRYLLSVTLNAPRQAFDDPAEPFFAGGSLDDLLRPQHLNMAFFGAQPLPSFAAYDVMKNPQIEQDLQRFRAHIRRHLLGDDNTRVAA